MTRLLTAALGLTLCAAPALAQSPSDVSPSASTTLTQSQILAQRGMDETRGWRGDNSRRDQSADDADDDDAVRDRGPSDRRSNGRGRRGDRRSLDASSSQQGRNPGDRQSPSDWQQTMARIHAGVAGMGADRGVRIRLRRGDMALDVRCPGSAPELNACIAAVTQLLDRVGPAGSAANGPRSPAAPAAPPAPPATSTSP